MQSAIDSLAPLLGEPFTLLRWSVLGMWAITVVIIAAHIFNDRPDGMLYVSIVSGLAVGFGAYIIFTVPMVVVAGGAIAAAIFLGLVVGVSVSINERLITTPF